MPPTIRLVIVEDHEMVRDALSAFMNATPGLQVVGSSGSLRDAIPLVETTHPDIALVDLSLDDGLGLELIRVVRRERLKTRVLIMSGNRDTFAVAEAMKSGAAGFVLKTSPTAELLEALTKVMAGELFLSPCFATLASLVLESAPTGLFELSQREGEVFRLVVSGSTSKEIAGRLCISVKTVETHRSNINRKLSINRPADLVRLAVAHGISVAPHSRPEHGRGGTEPAD
jgi:DNA-binding NarL/FixJ family response regulator